jgi:methionyl-tRNA formyltransferase
MTSLDPSARALRIVYMGTPEFAVPALQALIASRHEVVGVVTNPDKPSGRGRKLTSPPVKLAAQAAGIEVFQPKGLRKPEPQDHIRAWRPDLIIVAAYGRILPVEVLQIPPMGCLNIHASLLPAYRGAAPIQWSIVRGERESGVTIMQMAQGLDTGAMLLSGAVSIEPLDTAQHLHDKLTPLGATLLMEALEGLLAGVSRPVEQDDSLATWAPIIRKEDAFIDWSASAQAVADHIRGFNPWPGAATDLARGEERVRIKIQLARPVAGASGEPGSVIEVSNARLVVACGEGAIECLELQAPGRRAMGVRDFLNGFSIQAAERFVSPQPDVVQHD